MAVKEGGGGVVVVLVPLVKEEKLKENTVRSRGCDIPKDSFHDHNPRR